MLNAVSVERNDRLRLVLDEPASWTCSTLSASREMIGQATRNENWSELACSTLSASREMIGSYLLNATTLMKVLNAVSVERNDRRGSW